MEKICKILFILILLVLFPVKSNAALVTFGYETDIIQVGDILEVKIFLNTEGKQINAFKAAVKYSSNEFEFKKSSDANSAINFWVEEPGLVEDGNLVFSGITPGGLNGRDIEILTLEFEVIKEGVGSINLENVNTLLHDGLGTSVETKTIPLSLNILGQSTFSSAVTRYIDTEPPEAFTPVIVRDPDVFDGKNFLVFSTEDKGSGVDFYEVKEGEFSSYEKATSPYEIKDQTLSKSIFVKAVDFEDNEYIAIIYPQSNSPWYQTQMAKTAILVLCIVILLFLGRRAFIKHV